jgi:predicted alpha/beta superfamily hydrolase
MMLPIRLFSVFLLFVLFSCQSASDDSAPDAKAPVKSPPVVPSRIVELPNFMTANVSVRNVEVYLPPDYDTTKAYPVLYMHDGNNLFQTGRSYTGDEWGVDEAMDSLRYDWIVVGPFNSEERTLDYMPAKPYDAVADSIEVFMREQPEEAAVRFGGKLPKSDAYLRFLVEELKPHIDRSFSTRPERDYTMVMGSSMGGLISCYAMGEYPEVFGQAACLSTHWPALNGVFLEYLKSGLPTPHPEGSRIWMDHGTGTLDSLYAPYQAKANALMEANGWQPRENWEYRLYPGAIHDENSWRARLPDVFAFLAEGLPEQ